MNKEITEICTECVQLILDQYNNNYISFYTWLSSSSDYDFVYIYEKIFKKYYLETFKLETGILLSYYAVNLAHAIWSFYEVDRDINKLVLFINKFICSQFKDTDIYQLYLN
jgi:hypothetical protein